MVLLRMMIDDDDDVVSSKWVEIIDWLPELFCGILPTCRAVKDCLHDKVHNSDDTESNTFRSRRFTKRNLKGKDIYSIVEHNQQNISL